MNIEPGETKCPEFVETSMYGPKSQSGIKYKCPKCQGTGKLDWIEMVVGKKSNLVKPGVYIKEVDVSNKVWTVRVEDD
jgi:hypothetical protein